MQFCQSWFIIFCQFYIHPLGDDGVGIEDDVAVHLDELGVGCQGLVEGRVVVVVVLHVVHGVQLDSGLGDIQWEGGLDGVYKNFVLDSEGNYAGPGANTWDAPKLCKSSVPAIFSLSLP